MTATGSERCTATPWRGSGRGFGTSSGRSGVSTKRTENSTSSFSRGLTTSRRSPTSSCGYCSDAREQPNWLHEPRTFTDVEFRLRRKRLVLKSQRDLPKGAAPKFRRTPVCSRTIIGLWCRSGSLEKKGQSRLLLPSAHLASKKVRKSSQTEHGSPHLNDREIRLPSRPRPELVCPRDWLGDDGPPGGRVAGLVARGAVPGVWEPRGGGPG